MAVLFGEVCEQGRWMCVASIPRTKRFAGRGAKLQGFYPSVQNGRPTEGNEASNLEL